MVASLGQPLQEDANEDSPHVSVVKKEEHSNIFWQVRSGGKAIQQATEDVFSTDAVNVAYACANLFRRGLVKDPT